MIVVDVGDHAEDFGVFFGEKLNDFGVLLVKEIGRLNLVEGLFAVLLFLVGFFEVFQANKVDGFIADVDVIDFAELKVGYLDFDNFFNIGFVGPIPLDIFGDDFGVFLVEGFTFFLDNFVGETDEEKVLDHDGEHEPASVECALA